MRVFTKKAVGNTALAVFLTAFLCNVSLSATRVELLFSQQKWSGGSDVRAEIGCRLGLTKKGPSAFLFRTGYASLSSDEAGYLYPEIGFRWTQPFSTRSAIFGELGSGYLFGLDDGAEYNAPFAFLGTGFDWKPLPLLTLSAFVEFDQPFGTDKTKSSYGAGVGLAYSFGPKDSDGDWVPDDEDTCRNTPRGARVDGKGCALDSDGDGVFDGLDRCSGTPFMAMVDSTGCPKDSDDDGVFDGVDRCGETPSDIAVDSTGCPKDSDGDGVVDYIDTCAATPKGALVDEFGCPKDSDEDGVFDGIDQCPQTPSGFVVNSLGCPFVAPVENEEVRDAYDNGLNLKASALQKLDDIAERLRAYPFRMVEIGVYTDAEGSAKYNRNRSYRVAEKVRDILVARGVDRDQLELKGFGEVNPVASNSTSNGRKQNRRVVFRYIEDK